MPKVLTSIKLPKDFRDSLSAEAERENRTLTNLITTKLLEHDRMECALNYFKTILDVNDIMMLYDMIRDGKAKIIQEKEEHDRTIIITTKIKLY